MKVSLNWIKDFVDIGISAKELADIMTYTGTKAESWETLPENLQNIVVGTVLSTEKHPDADRLTVCKIDVGAEAPVQIITAATNVSAGVKVPVCLDGAILFDGTKIKNGKLRGLPSEGMLCSIHELGLTLNDFPYAEDDGIFLIQEECFNGQDIRDALNMRDEVIDFELTFNRPDCLGFIGIAREAAASIGKPFTFNAPKYAVSPAAGKVDDYISVDVRNTKLCPRYSAAVVTNVKIEPSPLWLRARLRAAGVRPINNIVDITNYVMLEYGQPMHAFDYNYITSKKIVVRNATKGERITTLDGNEHDLTENMLCIADGEKPVALAGVMGGLNSEILDSTVTVVFESANFDRASIRHTSRDCGLRTESSGKFEKGLPICNTVPALERALELVAMLGCGDIAEGIIDICNADIAPRKIPFDYKRVNALLGIELSREEMAEMLKPLEMFVEGDELVVPPYRMDMERTADIAEEVARLYGYNKIPSTLFKGEVTVGAYSKSQKLIADLKAAAVANGFYEIATYSFISPKAYDRIGMEADDARRNSIKLINPLGEDTSVMRTVALPSMLDVVAYNRNRKAEVIGLFECATVYYPTEDGMSDERKEFVIAMDGKGDFYDLKGYVEALLDSINVKAYKVVSGEEAGFHPGICAKLCKGDKVLAVMGQIHPAVAAEYGLSKSTYAAVLYVKELLDMADNSKQFKKLPAFPALTRDLALVMDDSVEAGAVEDMIRKSAGKALESIKVFDVYKGVGVAEGKKSVAFSLVFRLADKTMNDADADKAVANILRRLEAEAGIVLRA
ncbi:MAG: phenylalanine--tRNA ligase subunit beta [Clostridia bacterium]|nr:phenylalanine--tRNA ligase subunit beta [Clostridia bacterium]